MAKTTKNICIIALLIALIAMIPFASPAFADTSADLSKPAITVKADTIKGFTVKTKAAEDVDGYVIKYSKSSSYSSAVTKTVSGSRLSKTISGLTADKKYYVMVKSYKTIDGSKVYSSWSDTSSVTVRNYYIGYTTNIETKIYKKASSSSTSKKIWYMSKLKVYANTSSGSKGAWVKVRYKDQTYYMWIAKGDTKITKTKNSYNYKNSSNTEYQQQVIDRALYIRDNWKTVYKTAGYNDINANGEHEFDCSGFVSYVFSSLYQNEDYNMTYRPAHTITDQATPGIMYNRGKTGEFKSVVVCSGKLDISKLQPGDIIFFKLASSSKQDREVTHCGIYLGKNDFIHITQTRNKVWVTPIQQVYAESFVKAVRVLPEKFVPCDISATVNVTCGVYSNTRCHDEDKIEKLSSGTAVTIKYFTDKHAHITYGNGKSAIILLKNLSY